MPGTRCEIDFGGMAVREFAKHPHDGSAGALLSDGYNDPAQFDDVSDGDIVRDPKFANDAGIHLTDAAFQRLDLSGTYSCGYNLSDLRLSLILAHGELYFQDTAIANISAAYCMSTFRT
jgi:hypothetical protein